MTIIYEETGEEGGAEIPQQRIMLRVNGRKAVAEVEPRLLLAHLIRHGMGLTGTHTAATPPTVAPARSSSMGAR